MNPMIRKELRQRMRERRGWLLPSLYLVVLGAVVTFAYFMTTTDRGASGIQGIDLSAWRLFLTPRLLAARACCCCWCLHLQRRLDHD